MTPRKTVSTVLLAANLALLVFSLHWVNFVLPRHVDRFAAESVMLPGITEFLVRISRTPIPNALLIGVIVALVAKEFLKRAWVTIAINIVTLVLLTVAAFFAFLAVAMPMRTVG